MARARRRVPRPLALLLVLALAASGCGGSEDEPRSGNGTVYVALGDSYTSGPGLTPVADKPCRRASINYPSLVAKELKVSEFLDRSCGGANTQFLENPQMYGLGRVNDPQLDAVTKDTTLVTVSLGLNNDAISVGLLLTCLTPDGDTPSEKCQAYLREPDSAIEAQIEAAAAEVEAALETIKEKAPRARVVLVGYPRVVPDEGSCPDSLPVPEAQVERLRTALPLADRLWRDAARSAGATYVDMYAASEGHDICSDDPWIAGYRDYVGRGPLLHPFANYHQAVAERVISALGD